MRKLSAIYVTIIVLTAILVLFAYNLQRTSAPMPRATPGSVETAPGGG